MLDYLFLFLFFALYSVPIMFSFMVKGNPIFMVVNLLILVILFLITPTLSNVVREMWSSDEFSSYAYGGGGSYVFSIMTKIFQYLPLVTASLSAIIMVAMFAKGSET